MLMINISRNVRLLRQVQRCYNNCYLKTLIIQTINSLAVRIDRKPAGFFLSANSVRFKRIQLFCYENFEQTDL